MRKVKEIFLFLNMIVLINGKIQPILKIDDNNQALLKATENLIFQVFRLSEFATIRVMMASSNSSSSLINVDMGNEISKFIGREFKVFTRGDQRKGKIFEKKKTPIIFSLDSLASFESIKSRIEYDYPKYCLVLLTNGIFNEINDVIKSFWKNSISSVNFLVANQSKVFMYTFFPFAHEKCGEDLSLEVINTFDIMSEKWSGKRFYPHKVTNLHQCVLKVGVTVNIPLVIIKNNSNGVEEHDGIEVYLINEIAKDFKFIPKFSKSFASIGSIYNNGSSSGLLGSVYKREKDFAIGSLSLQIERSKFLSVTSSFASIPIVLVIPPAPPISPFAKLYLPFDLTTWSLLIAMFLFGYFIIIISRFFSQNFYKFIVGRNVRYPFMNMFIAFFGTSQNVLPSNNFSRFILGKFLIFCLVIRGLYQGKLFDIMQKDINEREPEKIDDLISKNFLFYTYESLSKRVQGQSFEKKVKMIKNAEIEEYRQKTLEHTFKGVVFNYEYQLVYLNEMNKKNFTYIILKEKFVTNQMVFYLPENHYMTEIVSEKIEWYREFGILTHVISKYVDNVFLVKIPEEKSAESLKFKDLSAVFGIWLVGLGFSFISCFIEIGIGCKNPLGRCRKKKTLQLIIN